MTYALHLHHSHVAKLLSVSYNLNMPKKNPLRPPKETNVLNKIRQCIKEGKFAGTLHSEQRSIERKIDILDVIEVLETGRHEQSKDEYRPDFQSWNYAIRGKTADGDELRIAVFFKEEAVVVATIIRI